MIFRKLSEDAADFGLPMEPLPAPSHWQQNTTCRLAHSQAIMHHRDTTKAPAGQLDHSSTTATTGTPKPQGHQRTTTVSKDTTPAAQHESTTRTPCTPQAPPKTKPFVRAINTGTPHGNCWGTGHSLDKRKLVGRHRSTITKTQLKHRQNANTLPGTARHHAETTWTSMGSYRRYPWDASGESWRHPYGLVVHPRVLQSALGKHCSLASQFIEAMQPHFVDPPCNEPARKQN